MKRLFKILLGLIVFLLIVIGIPLGVSYYYLVDKVDESPLEYYDETITLESELSNIYDYALDLEDKDYIDLSFTEESLNKLIFAMIRENKPEFNPNSNNEANKYLEVVDLGELIPQVRFFSGKKALVKNVYAQIENNQLYLYIPVELMGIKSRLKLAIKFSETADVFNLEFKTLGLGKANLLSGLASKILNKIFEVGNFSSDSLNQTLADKNIPFTIDIANFTLSADKDKLEELVYKLINPADMEDSTEKEMLTEFVALISSKQNDLIDFGVFNNEKFGLRFDLAKFKVNTATITLNSSVKNFDQDNFVMNKVQNFVISNIVASSDPKMKFSNNDFNAIIYSQSHAYQDFVVSIPLPNSTSTFTIKIIGILVDFNHDNVEFRINVNLNGLNTSIKVKGTILNNDSTEVKIKIDDSITLGEDIGLNDLEYIEANSSLILSLLSDNISEMGVMQFDQASNAFILSVDSFKQLMDLGDNNQTPLNVKKLKIVENGIEVYCEIDASDSFFAALASATNALTNALTNVDLSSDKFDTNDLDEMANVQSALAALDNVSQGISDGNLDEVATNNLIDAINGMSSSNQEVFLAALESSASSDDLEGLYNSLFGQ